MGEKKDMDEHGDNTLSAETKERILCEEQYRHKISSTFTGGGWLTLLNKPIFIWFLSTIVIGAITSMYQSCEQKARDEQASLRSSIAKIDRLYDDNIQMFKFYEAFVKQSDERYLLWRKNIDRPLLFNFALKWATTNPNPEAGARYVDISKELIVGVSETDPPSEAEARRLKLGEDILATINKIRLKGLPERKDEKGSVIFEAGDSTFPEHLEGLPDLIDGINQKIKNSQFEEKGRYDLYHFAEHRRRMELNRKMLSFIPDVSDARRTVEIKSLEIENDKTGMFISTLIKDTANKLEWSRMATSDLESSFRNLYKIIVKHASLLSEKELGITVKGDRALAVSQMLSEKLNRNAYSAVDKVVEQFNEDWDALEKLAGLLTNNWKETATFLHNLSLRQASSLKKTVDDSEERPSLDEPSFWDKESFQETLQRSRMMNEKLQSQLSTENMTQDISQTLNEYR